MKVKNYIKHPSKILLHYLHSTRTLWSDKAYIKIKYRLLNGTWPDLKNPQSFNEKLNWLKIHDRNSRYTLLADKYKVKEIVSDLTNNQLLTAKCLGVWDHADQIEFSKLPSRFVLKCTHDSGSMVICKDKSTLDIEKTKKKMEEGLDRDFYLFSREWPYKNIEKRIIAEEYIEPDSGDTLRDYKFWCFNGEPKLMYVTNKIGEIYENFYDMDFKPVNIEHGSPRYIPEFEKPCGFEKMKKFAKTLSHGIPFVRIDFWNVKDKVYFGEFTFYDWAGFMPFNNKDQDIELGSWINLSAIKNDSN